MAVEPAFLLDSNIGIYLIGGEAPRAAARLAACGLGTVVTSSICLAEMLVGRTAVEIAGIMTMLGTIQILPFDDAAARVYGTLPFKRRNYDRLVAAQALSLGLILVTANERDFTDIVGLRVENWMLA